MLENHIIGATTFFDILLSLSSLYVKAHVLAEELRRSRLASSERNGPTERDISEKQFRDRFREALRAVPWSCFEAASAFSKFTGLHSAEDYVQRFALHLPEIYAETLRLDDHLRSFRAQRDAGVRADLLIGLQHMGRNHAIFVIPALEWASDADNWDWDQGKDHTKLARLD